MPRAIFPTSQFQKSHLLWGQGAGREAAAPSWHGPNVPKGPNPGKTPANLGKPSPHQTHLNHTLLQRNQKVHQDIILKAEALFGQPDGLVIPIYKASCLLVGKKGGGGG